MGERGPVPKRSTQVRRRNERSTEKRPGAKKVTVPRAEKDWHPIAKSWYLALARSGQAVYYEPSDWALAKLIAESMSRDLKPQVVGITETGKVVSEVIPLKGASLAAYLKAMNALLVSEADRRRAGVELERATAAGTGTDNSVALLDEYRDRFSG